MTGGVDVESATGKGAVLVAVVVVAVISVFDGLCAEALVVVVLVVRVIVVVRWVVGFVGLPQQITTFSAEYQTGFSFIAWQVFGRGVKASWARELPNIAHEDRLSEPSAIRQTMYLTVPPFHAYGALDLEHRTRLWASYGR